MSPAKNKIPGKLQVNKKNYPINYCFTKKIEYASEYFETSPGITGFPFFQYFTMPFSSLSAILFDGNRNPILSSVRNRFFSFWYNLKQ